MAINIANVQCNGGFLLDTIVAPRHVDASRDALSTFYFWPPVLSVLFVGRALCVCVCLFVFLPPY